MADKIIKSMHDLAKLFTRENPLPQGQKYLASGMKPIEEFCSDIAKNLVSWAYDGSDTVFYRTHDHWYAFRKIDDPNIVLMTRYENGHSYERLDDWANTHSVEGLGKAWLGQPEQLKKRAKVL